MRQMQVRAHTQSTQCQNVSNILHARARTHTHTHARTHARTQTHAHASESHGLPMVRLEHQYWPSTHAHRPTRTQANHMAYRLSKWLGSVSVYRWSALSINIGPVVGDLGETSYLDQGFGQITLTPRAPHPTLQPVWILWGWDKSFLVEGFQ